MAFFFLLFGLCRLLMNPNPLTAEMIFFRPERGLLPWLNSCQLIVSSRSAVPDAVEPAELVDPAVAAAGRLVVDVDMTLLLRVDLATDLEGEPALGAKKLAGFFGEETGRMDLEM